MSQIFYERVNRSKDPKEEMKILAKRLGFRVNQRIAVNDKKAYEKLKLYTKEYEERIRLKSEQREKEKRELSSLLKEDKSSLN